MLTRTCAHPPQVKSLRQDLTLQRIRNDFTVEVYEMHARICLEFGDMTEFNQCQAQLTQLYEEGLGTADGQREFTSYNILYNVGKNAVNNVGDLLRELTPDDYADKFVSAALAGDSQDRVDRILRSDRRAREGVRARLGRAAVRDGMSGSNDVWGWVVRARV